MPRKALRALLLTASCLGAWPAIAQEGPPEEEDRGLNEIVVTAQRRAESVQDVPIAISAFDAEELNTRGITEALDIIQFVPNLFGSNNTGLGSANAYYLRGLGNTETVATFDPPVGTYVDEIYLSRQNANNLSLFDVERIEVLRGPQGTLFGRNTTGGAISIILREPGADFGGYAEAGFGRFNRRLARASVDVPLSDSFFTKVSGFWEDDDGYVKNTTTDGRINDGDGWGARLAIRGVLSDRVFWNGSYARIVDKGENILNFLCDPANPQDCDGRFATTGLVEGRVERGYYGVPISGRKATYGQSNEAAQDLVISNLEWEVADGLTLNFITGYVSLVQQFGLDFFDGRGGPSAAQPTPPVRRFATGGFVILNDGQHEQFTQEVKLVGDLLDGRLNFVTGAYYFDEDNRTDFADIFTLGITPTGFPLLLADRTLENSTIAYAGYAQADFALTEQLSVTAGIRYTDESKRFSIRDNRPQCRTALGPTCLDDRNLVAATGAPIPRELVTREWTPRFVINYEPDADILLFASATRGFKSGGWNARGTLPGQLLPFGPELVWSYEAGLKSELLGDRLRVNLTGYWADVEDLQTPSALVAPSGAITFITRNFADYENKGIEAEITAVPVEGLNLYANVGYQDDNYIIDGNAEEFDEFGIQSVAAQQAACLAQLAAGQIPGGTNTSPPGQPPNNAPACGAGIVAPDGSIATPVRTPDWSLAFGGTYELPLGGSGMALVPSVNATYRSDFEVGTNNLSFYGAPITGVNGTFPSNPFGEGEFITGSDGSSYWLFNASLVLRGAEDRWSLSVECENCFDEEYLQSALANYSYYNMPATWLVRGRVNF